MESRDFQLHYKKAAGRFGQPHACQQWSVWEHEKAHKGDRYFLVRCGEGKTGICMSGRFRSEPYLDEDWSGKGREVYYMDLRADTVIDPDRHS